MAVGSDYVTGDEPGSKIESGIGMVSGQNLYNLFRGMPLAGHGKISPGFIFLCRHKTANLIDNIIHVTAEAILRGILVVHHAYRNCYRFLYSFVITLTNGSALCCNRSRSDGDGVCTVGFCCMP